METLLALVLAALVGGLGMLVLRPARPAPPMVVYVQTPVESRDGTGCLLLAIPVGIVLLLMVWGSLASFAAP